MFMFININIMKYKIYHIPQIKIGCSINPSKRVKVQGYETYEILEEYDDIDQASKREAELQKLYGYKEDCTLYKQTISAPTNDGKKKGGQNGALRKWQLDNPELYKKIQKEAAIAGGKKQGSIQGKKNIESGLISSLGKKNAEKNNRLQTCQYCGITTRGAGYVRWHGEKCKSKL